MAVAIAAGCGGSQKGEPDAAVAPGASTAEALEGIWLLEGGDAMVRFSRDGTWAIGANGTLAAFGSDGGVESHAEGFGTYALDGDRVVFTHESTTDGCDPGETIVWRSNVLRDGVVEAEHTAACEPEAVGLVWTLRRVSPESRLQIRVPQVPEASTFAPAEGNLRGVYALAGTSTLLALAGDGRYALDDEGKLETEPADVGTLRVDGSRLTFTSGSSSRRCSSDDVLVLERARMFSAPPILFALAGRVTQDTCARGIEGDVTFAVISL